MSFALESSYLTTKKWSFWFNVIMIHNQTDMHMCETTFAYIRSNNTEWLSIPDSGDGNLWGERWSRTIYNTLRLWIQPKIWEDGDHPQCVLEAMHQLHVRDRPRGAGDGVQTSCHGTASEPSDRWLIPTRGAMVLVSVIISSIMSPVSTFDVEISLTIVVSLINYWLICVIPYILDQGSGAIKLY